MLLPQLRRVRWAVRAALFLGVAASVAANILHANPNPISQTIAAWPPLALLITVELTSRIPMHKRGLAALRVLSTIAIAGIAAWVSYWHMQGVAGRYGETQTSSYLLPISVDGLIVVASVSLVELGGRVRLLEDQRESLRLRAELAATAAQESSLPPTPDPAFAAPAAARPTASGPTVSGPRSTPEPASPTPPASAPASTARPAPAPANGSPGTGTRPVKSLIVPSEPISMGPRTPVSPLSGKPLASAAPGTQTAGSSPAASVTQDMPVYVNGSAPSGRPSVTHAAVSTPARTMVTTRATESATPRQRRPVQETVDLADEIEALNPDISEAELATRLGISVTRLRQARREAREVRQVS